jgi:hypothetical protein
MGKEYRTVFNRSSGLTDEEKKKFYTVRSTFNTYFKTLKLKKGYHFRHTSREKMKRCNLQYITVLRDIADKC